MKEGRKGILGVEEGREVVEEAREDVELLRR